MAEEQHSVFDYTTSEGKEKLLAETRKVEAEIQKLQADERRAEEKHKRELTALDIAVKKGEYVLETDRIIRDRNQREEAMVLACDWNHQVYNFSDVIDEENVHMCMNTLQQWVRQHKARNEQNPLEIEIIFDSPGGNVFDGMHLFDDIRWIRKAGHKVTTVALGNAASMAGILLQAGDPRVIGEESYLLLHKASSTQLGSMDSDEYESTLERLRKLEGRMVNIICDRAAQALVKRTPEREYREAFDTTKALIESKWKKNDWWLDSGECLEYGFVDEIR